MASRHRSARRRRRGSGRTARLAIFFAIPVVLGLVIGAVVALTGGGSQNPAVAATPLGALQTPSESGTTASPAATGSAPIITDAANVNCDIIVPANPLSAQGLATPTSSPARAGCRRRSRAAR